MLVPYAAPQTFAWAKAYPAAWIVPVSDWLKAFLYWLARDLSFGLFTFKEMTRFISGLFGYALAVPKARSPPASPSAMRRARCIFPACPGPG